MEKDLLSPQELEMVKGAFGVDIRTYGLKIQGVLNCCNTNTYPPGSPDKK